MTGRAPLAGHEDKSSVHSSPGACMQVPPQRVHDQARSAPAPPTRAIARVVDRRAHDPAAERRALVAGLLSAPASIAPKYFYDAARLRAVRCDLRAPRVLPDAHRGPHFRSLSTRHRRRGRNGQATGRPRRRRLREGRGVVAMARTLSATLRSISRTTRWRAALAQLASRIPGYRRARRHHRFHARPRAASRCRRTMRRRISIPGSSIGNFPPIDALYSCRRSAGIAAPIPSSGLLIGVDTKKDAERLRAAYDDADGVTAAFNRNVLAHVNRASRTRIPIPEAFAHVAFYDEAASRVEMHPRGARATRP